MANRLICLPESAIDLTLGAKDRPSKAAQSNAPWGRDGRGILDVADSWKVLDEAEKEDSYTEFGSEGTNVDVGREGVEGTEAGGRSRVVALDIDEEDGVSQSSKAVGRERAAVGREGVSSGGNSGEGARRRAAVSLARELQNGSFSSSSRLAAVLEEEATSTNSGEGGM